MLILRGMCNFGDKKKLRDRKPGAQNFEEGGGLEALKLDLGEKKQTHAYSSY